MQLIVASVCILAGREERTKTSPNNLLPRHRFLSHQQQQQRHQQRRFSRSSRRLPQELGHENRDEWRSQGPYAYDFDDYPIRILNAELLFFFSHSTFLPRLFSPLFLDRSHEPGPPHAVI